MNTVKGESKSQISIWSHKTTVPYSRNIQADKIDHSAPICQLAAHIYMHLDFWWHWLQQMLNVFSIKWYLWYKTPTKKTRKHNNLHEIIAANEFGAILSCKCFVLIHLWFCQKKKQKRKNGVNTTRKRKRCPKRAPGKKIFFGRIKRSIIKKTCYFANNKEIIFF